MTYTITVEKFHETYDELKHLYLSHYQEMQTRLKSEGVETSDYNPRLDEYEKASIGGWLLTIVARLDSVAVGYCNVYITNDMHNRDLIAIEDALYVDVNHRNGLGKKIVQFGMNELKNRGVKRLNVSAMTDLNVAKLWERMGAKHTAHSMTFVL
jgi:hypothetical protein